jgi:hypothetical protein
MSSLSDFERANAQQRNAPAARWFLGCSIDD